MPNETIHEESYVQLATRIPQRLHREIKLHCVTVEQSVMAFVTAALTEKLGRSNGTGRGRAGRKPRLKRKKRAAKKAAGE